MLCRLQLLTPWTWRRPRGRFGCLHQSFPLCFELRSVWVGLIIHCAIIRVNRICNSHLCQPVVVPFKINATDRNSGWLRLLNVISSVVSMYMCTSELNQLTVQTGRIARRFLCKMRLIEHRAFGNLCNWRLSSTGPPDKPYMHRNKPTVTSTQTITPLTGHIIIIYKIYWTLSIPRCVS